MIKKQYEHLGLVSKSGYFNNFLTQSTSVVDELKKYNATLGKSKKMYGYNVKWHDEKLYMMFVLRYS